MSKLRGSVGIFETFFGLLYFLVDFFVEVVIRFVNNKFVSDEMRQLPAHKLVYHIMQHLANIS